MKAAQFSATVPRRTGKTWKGLGLGALGVGLACLGCCLAPFLGVLLTVGAGASFAGFFRSWTLLAVLGTLALVLAIFVVRKSRRAACCPQPGSECGADSCRIPPSISTEKGIGQ